MRLADRVGVAQRGGTTEPTRSQGPVGRGGRNEGLRLGGLRNPPVRAGGPRSDEGAIKLSRHGRYADLVLHACGTLRQGRVDR